MKAIQAQQQVGAAIRRYREKLGVSQEAFADQITMHRTYYSAIERGERNLTLRSLMRVADGLGINLSQLLADAAL